MVVEGMFADRVSKGIELLYLHIPGWFNKINWDELCMEWPQDCILGQLYGSFNTGTSALDISELAPEFGFDLSRKEYSGETPVEVYFWELQAEWKRQMEVNQ